MSARKPTGRVPRARAKPMMQEVRVQIDVSLTVDARHSAAVVADMVERGARRCFPNNHKEFNHVRFAEEAAIYSLAKTIVWTPVPALTDGPNREPLPGDPE